MYQRFYFEHIRILLVIFFKACTIRSAVHLNIYYCISNSLKYVPSYQRFVKRYTTVKAIFMDIDGGLSCSLEQY